MKFPALPPKTSVLNEIQQKPVDPLLLSESYYLYLFALLDTIKALGKELDVLQAEVDAIVIGAGSISYLLDLGVLVTATTTTITSPVGSPNPNDRLIVILQQPAAGDALIDLDPGPPAFKLVTPDDIVTLPNVVTTLTFICRTGGDWWLSQVPMTSRTP